MRSTTLSKGCAAATQSVLPCTSPSFSGTILQGFTEARPHFPSGGFLFWPNNDSHWDLVPAGYSCCQGLDFLHAEKGDPSHGDLLLASPGCELHTQIWPLGPPEFSDPLLSRSHTREHLLFTKFHLGTQNIERYIGGELSHSTNIYPPPMRRRRLF